VDVKGKIYLVDEHESDMSTVNRAEAVERNEADGPFSRGSSKAI